MGDPNIILTLSAVDDHGPAGVAFRLPHNLTRYFEPSAFDDDGPSRETTPFVNAQTETEDQTRAHRIRLDFEQKPKTPGRFTFGTDPNLCDVLLGGKRRQHHISSQHFHITFNAKKRIILQDVSTNSTTILFDRLKKIIVDLRELAFDVHLADHKACENEHKANVDEFCAQGRESLPSFDILAIRSQDTSVAPSQTLSPKQRPIYLMDAELGCGSFGRVCKVIDVSTGLEYAGKEFFHRKGWEREVEIMRGLHHEYIVQFVDFSTEMKPLLVMEYLPLENLEDQHLSSPIAVEETIILMCQSLSAIEYLHGQNVPHRDVKPSNILVQSRMPFIKLADFGLAKDRSALQTFCGTLNYAAPEIYQSQVYSNAVDQWSLGVVMMEYAYGLPSRKGRQRAANKQDSDKKWGFSWFRRLIEAVADWESDALIDFLSNFMLK